MCEPVDSLSGKAGREVWLPDGNQWYDMAHKQLLKPGIHKLAYRIDQNAWFVKAGAIIPLAAKGIQHLQEPTNAWRIFIAPGSGKSTYLHYEDDGVSQAYPTQFATTRIRKNAAGSGLMVEIAPREGSYKGMPRTRVLTVVLGGLSRCPKATLDGQELPCSYSSTTRVAEVYLPEHDAQQAIKLTVKY